MLLHTLLSLCLVGYVVAEELSIPNIVFVLADDQARIAHLLASKGHPKTDRTARCLSWLLCVRVGVMSATTLCHRDSTSQEQGARTGSPTPHTPQTLTTSRDRPMLYSSTASTLAQPCARPPVRLCSLGALLTESASLVPRAVVRNPRGAVMTRSRCPRLCLLLRRRRRRGEWQRFTLANGIWATFSPSQG